MRSLGRGGTRADEAIANALPEAEQDDMGEKRW
jgi:hypothetical protein